MLHIEYWKILLVVAGAWAYFFFAYKQESTPMDGRWHFSNLWPLASLTVLLAIGIFAYAMYWVYVFLNH